MQKTVEQLQAEWVSHRNIARLQAKLASEQTKVSAKLWKDCLRASAKQLRNTISGLFERRGRKPKE